MRTSFLLCLVIIFLAGCVSTGGIRRSKDWDQRGAESARGLLLGKWLGQSLVKGGGTKTWLMERFADGTFVVTFRNVTRSGSVEDDSEYGDWGLSGDVYFTMTRGWIRSGRRVPVRSRDSYFDDAYIVQKLTAAEFVYKSVADGDVYTVRKVPATYTLP